MPGANPLTDVVAEVLSRKVAAPLRTVHKPLPLDNEPAKVLVLAQMFWSGPAVMVAGVVRVMIIVSDDSSVGPVKNSQTKRFSPMARPDTIAFGLVASSKVPLPETTDHKPVVITGEFPANCAEGAQTDISEPALAISEPAYAVAIENRKASAKAQQMRECLYNTLGKM